MKFLKVFLTLCFFLLFFAGCVTADYKGKIQVGGSEPHTYIMLLIDEEKIYKITGPLTEELARKYQNKTVLVEGEIIRKSKGPDFPAVLKVKRIVKTYKE